MGKTGKGTRTPYNNLKRLIVERKARVAVMGVGRVGLPLAVQAASAGFSVYGIDPDKSVMERARKGQTDDADSATLKRLLRSGALRLSSRPAPLDEAHVVVICVPTPLKEGRELNLQFVEDAARSILQHSKRNKLALLESTTYPGTTEEVLKPILESRGKKVGKSVFLAHSPERLDPGNARFNIGNTTKLVGGVTGKCANLAELFYKSFINKVVQVSSPRVAEMAKIFENIFRSVNIALVNELTGICSRMGLDMYEVSQAAATKEFGFMAFKPGPGVGGHCIPLDPYYLLWKSRQFDAHPRFVQLALEINENMPYYVVEKLADAFNKKKKSINGSKLLLLGISYKADVSDVRESPALKIFELLEKAGAKVRYHDPYCPMTKLNGKARRSVDLRPKAIKDSDAVIITTAHSRVDYGLLLKHASMIFDTRYVFKDMNPPANLVTWL